MKPVDGYVDLATTPGYFGIPLRLGFRVIDDGIYDGLDQRTALERVVGMEIGGLL